MLYFAYGSNLDPDQMRSRCPESRVVGLAMLRDHRLTFPLYSEFWGGGAAGVSHAHGSTVWGVLYELSDDDLAKLDQYEGWRGVGDHHNLYDRDTVTVELTRPDDGSVPRRVRAYTYLARTLNPTPPSRRYLDVVLKGARHHRLPPEYVEALAAVEVGSETA
ncbi:MAG: gamma-glutamylcyclotransferase [Candidatus Eisenbacteria bacterium]|uniref:Gamma-glutamylcyclotransferase n=1 Tax=Eiseniibacteriota bacterium TaxID=2212470 RepID=A0A538UBG3_UNCEI|nr:MAG: gamma-glutamylcyclotransferase [Candidatus Eisenbacteria bacterium]